MISPDAIRDWAECRGQAPRPSAAQVLHFMASDPWEDLPDWLERPIPFKRPAWRSPRQPRVSR